MEYRDQLKYIKSHQYEEDERLRRKKKDKRKKEEKKVSRNVKKGKRKKKLDFLDKLLWRTFFLVSVLFVGIMYMVDFFPIPYLIAAGGILLSILMIIKIMQQRALRSQKWKPRGKLLTLLMIAAVGIGGFYLLKVNAAMNEVAIEEETGGNEEIYGIDVTTKAFNIYISGIDVYGEITTESRSDVNLVITVNPKIHKILITTTPRDYYVTIPGISEPYKDKLTHAGVYGIDASMSTLENLYGTEIPFYARVNFTSVIDIVDAMGGIDVESEVAFTTSKAAGTVVEIKEGNNHLNGEQALAFVRERKAFVDGDHQRGRNQQALMSALIQKAISPMILIQANDMIDGITGNAETNMTEAQMKSLIEMQLNDLNGWEIETVAATGDDSGKQYCYSYSGGPLYVCVPDDTCVAEIRQKMEEYMGEYEE